MPCFRKPLLKGMVVLLVASLAFTGLAHDFDRLLRGVQKYGKDGVSRFQDWRTLIVELPRVAEADKLLRVNEFFNKRIRFAEDSAVWGLVDYWATPMELLGRGVGDCEDYAIAKYFSLVEAGVERSKLRLIYVRAVIGLPETGISQAHMVLGYYARPGGEPLVLDSLVTEIKPASKRPDLKPVFSFNGEGVWSPGSERPTTPVDRLSRWTDLVSRMRPEGFEP